MKTEQRIADIRRKGEEEIAATKARVDRDVQRVEESARRTEAQRKEREDLRARLEEEWSMSDHPKRDTLWNKAWEHGHSSGLSGVRYWYEDLIELAK